MPKLLDTLGEIVEKQTSWFNACRLADAEVRLDRLQQQGAPDQILHAGQHLVDSARRRVEADPEAQRLMEQARQFTFVEGAKRDMFRMSGAGKLDELVEILLLQHPEYPDEDRPPELLTWDSSVALFKQGIAEGNTLKILMGLNGILDEIRHEHTMLGG